MSGVEIILLIILIILSGFFSGVETAFVSLDRVKLRQMKESGAKNSDLVTSLKDDPHKLISTLLIGNNLVNIGASAIATAIAIDIWGNLGVAIATGVMTFVILFFGEITPKSIAMAKSEAICSLASPFIYFLSKLLVPVLWFSDLLTKKLSHIFGGRFEDELITEEEIMSFVKMGEEIGSIEKDEKEMINNIFQMNDTEIKDIMVPKVKIVSINGSKRIKDVVKKVINSGHSRFPVYIDEKDNIKGILFTKDLMKELTNNNADGLVKDICQDVFFVPETKKADLLLHDFQKKKVHMAIAVNEYGDVTGIVTLEDVLEEIVGEIYDETDKVEVKIKKVDSKMYDIDGETHLDEIAKKTGYRLKTKNDINTISGYIMDKVGRIPKQGEILDLKKLKLRISAVNGNRIEKVKMIVK